jgi:hypothetical protein
MTVTYTAQVATCTGLGCFWKLLFWYFRAVASCFSLVNYLFSFETVGKALSTSYFGQT